MTQEELEKKGKAISDKFIDFAVDTEIPFGAFIGLLDNDGKGGLLVVANKEEDHKITLSEAQRNKIGMVVYSLIKEYDIVLPENDSLPEVTKIKTQKFRSEHKKNDIEDFLKGQMNE